MSTVSIIVPVYNAENYIGRCVDSIIKQTYRDIELILIDDGSDDSSYEICEEYAKRDNRIRLLRQDNAGPSCARNAALECAVGKYIQFVDSDDYLDERCVESLYNTIDNNKCDLGICSYYEVRDNGIRKCKDAYTKKYNRYTYSLELASNPISYYHGVLWNKIYRRDIITKNKLKFNIDIRFGEDFVFNLSYLEKINKIVSISDGLYYYYCYSSDTLSKFQKSIYDRVNDRVTLYEFYLNYWKNIGLYRLMRPVVDAYIVQFYLSETKRTIRASSLLEEGELERYLEYIEEQCIGNFKISSLELSSFRTFKALRNVYWSIRNYGLKNSINDAAYKLIVNTRKRYTKKRKVLLYADSKENLRHIRDYYNQVRDLKNVKFYRKDTGHRYDLVVCAGIGRPEGMSNRKTKMLCINRGTNSLSYNEGIRPYIYEYNVTKEEKFICDYDVVLEPNRRYAALLTSQYEMFIGIPYATGYKFYEDIMDVKKARDMLNVSDSEKLILVCGCLSENSIFNNEELFEKLSHTDYRVVVIGCHVEGKLNNSESNIHSITERYGYEYITSSKDYIPYIAAAHGAFCDYAPILEELLLARKPVVLSEFKEQYIYTESLSMMANDSLYHYRSEDSIESMLLKASNVDADIYIRANKELAVSKDDYRDNIKKITSTLLK